MTIEEFHKVLLCIVYGSSEIFNQEFIKHNIDCLNCPYKAICDKVINVYFQNKYIHALQSSDNNQTP
jgi:hypothetical protein